MERATHKSNQLTALGTIAILLGLVALVSQVLDLLSWFNAGYEIAVLAGLVAAILGGHVVYQTVAASLQRRLGVTALILVAVAWIPTLFALVTVPAAILIAFYRWRNAVCGWRWWAATTLAAVLGLIVGSFLAMMVLIIAGTGDPRWNLPLWYGISVELLDYLTVAVAAMVAGAITGIAGTRRLLRAFLVMVVSIVAISVLWLLMVHPQHTNDITWQMSDSVTLLIPATIVGTATVSARLLRRSGTTMPA